MKLLTVSTLFPNDKEPKHGIFVRNRLNHLINHFPDVQSKVIAPVPWFPFKAKSGALAEYGKFVGVTRHEQFGEIEIFHPRYLVIPKIGMYLTPFFLFLSMWWTARRIKKSGYAFEVIDGHYFYPDGIAIALLARVFGCPFTVTARGTDINLIPRYPLARRMIQWAAGRANGIITVCKALKDELLEFADVADKTRVLRNGVDLTFFTATDQASQQALKHSQWAVPEDKKLIASVGHLIERKGHHLVIESLKGNPDWHLVIAGDGVEMSALQNKAKADGVEQQVTFAGALSQQEVRELYQAADAMVLASSREGWANVLLESMACGTAVVATNLWGTPEVVAAPEAGILVDRDALSIAQGLKALFANPPQRSDTRRYAEGFDWFSTSEGQYHLFSSLIQSQPAITSTESV